MLALLPKLRLPWLALVAILGVALLGQGTAQACGSGQVAAKRSCCRVEAPTGCGGCCDTSASKSTDSVSTYDQEGVAKSLARPLAAPSRHCECRSQEPTAPTSSKPESERIQRAAENGTEAAPPIAQDSRLLRAFRRTALAGQFPARTPLYLRVSHLLI